MLWKTRLKDVVHGAVARKALRIVLSPDVDGILSTVLVSEYARRMGVEPEVIGSYDSSKLRLVPPYTVADAKAALWVDLDVAGMRCIGQHFLGTVQDDPRSFNPNLVFHVHVNMREKCPVSTTHLVLWGLFPTEAAASAVLAHKFSLARSAVAHADSLYIIVESYRPNVERWMGNLFPDGNLPRTMDLLLDGTYRREAKKIHRHFLNLIEEDVVHFRPLDDTWESFKGRQSVGDVAHLSTVQKMLRLFAKLLRVDPPRQQDGERVAWEGKRVMLDTVQFDWADPGFEALLKKEGVVSHALVNARTCSVTVGEAF